MMRLIERLSELFRGTTKRETVPAPFQSITHALQAAFACHQAGRLEEAEKIYHQILAAAPDDFNALHLLGALAQERGQSGRAVELITRALSIGKGNPYAYSNLGVALYALRRFCEAEECFQKAIALDSRFAGAHFNLGNALRENDRLEQAEKSYREVLMIEPSHLGATKNLGLLLQELGRPQEAEEYCNLAIKLSPNDASAQWNLSLLELLRGNYGDGLARYEARLECNEQGVTGSNALWRQFKERPTWRGESLAGKRILLWTEQGFGDSIMTMRYLPMLAKREASEVSVYCEKPLVRLFAEIRGVDRTISFDQSPPLDDFDVHCPMMSLPYLFATRLDAIANQVPYLAIPEPLGDKWARRFSSLTGDTRIGLVWAGSSALRYDARRSIRLHEFEPLLSQPGIRLFSLQKGEASKQLEELGWDILDWIEDCHDFMDTAALVQNLDLVISVDTAVAHLAGALGKPVWLLNRFESEWRWGLEREDSPWYPTMRIFRQSKSCEWASVIQHLKAELERQAAQR